MSDFEDKLANAIGAFKMQLDARPNVPSIERRQSGVITRESSFGSQLPDIRPQPSIEKRTPTYSITFSDYPTTGEFSFGDTDPNGTLPLTSLVKTPNADGSSRYSYRSDVKSSTSTTNPRFVLYYRYVASINIPVAPSNLSGPWDMNVAYTLSPPPPDPNNSLSEVSNASLGVPISPGPEAGTFLLFLDWNISA